MKLPAKPPTKVERLSKALERAVTKGTWFQPNGHYFNVDGTLDLRILAAALFGPDPVLMPSTEAMAAHMDEFYAACIEEAARGYRDSLLMASHPGFLDNAGVPTG